MPDISIKIIVDGKEAIATLSLTKEQLEDIAKEAGAAGKSASSSLSNIGNVITGLNQGLELAKKGIDIISKPLNLSMDAEQAQISFEVLLGSAQKARDMVAGLKEDATRTPYEFTDLQQATKVLLNFGIESEKVRGILSMLGDVSSGDAQKMQQLALVFGQVASAGKLQGQDLLQLINAGFNPLQEISRTTGKSMADLRKEMEQGGITFTMVEDAFRSVTSEGGLFYQMMDKQSQSGKGLLSTLSDIGNQVITSVGNEMLPLLKETTKALSDVGASLLPVENNFDKATMAGTTLSTRFEELSFNIERLGSKASRTADEEKIFQESLDSLQKEYPNYFKSLDIHKTKYNDLVTAIGDAKIELDKYIESMISAALVQDKMSEITDLGKKKYEATKSKLEAERKYNEADSAGTLDKEDPQLKKDALLAGNRLLKVATTREILNAQVSYADKTIKEATDKIADLRTEIEGLKKSAAGIIPPGNDGKGSSTSTSTDGKDPFAKAKEKELEDIQKRNGKILAEEMATAMGLQQIQETLVFEREYLIELENNIRDAKDQKELDRLKFEQDLAVQRIKIYEDEAEKKRNAEEKAFEGSQKNRAKRFDDEKKRHKEQKEQSQELKDLTAENIKDEFERAKEQADNKRQFAIDKANEEIKDEELKKKTLLQIEEQHAQEIERIDKESAERRIQILTEVFNNISRAFGQIGDIVYNSAKRESDSYKKTELDKLKTDREKALSHARTQAQKDRINKQFDEKQKQIEDEADARAREKAQAWYEVQKAASVANATISTYEGANKAFAQGGIFGYVLGAAIIAAGLANVASIIATPLPGYEKGGLLAGGEQIIRVNEKGPEFIINHEATKKYFPFLQAINEGKDLPAFSNGGIVNPSALFNKAYNTRMALQDSVTVNNMQSSAPVINMNEVTKEIKGLREAFKEFSKKEWKISDKLSKVQYYSADRRDRKSTL